MKINENTCYYCGIKVDPNNYEEIGNTTIWVCDDRLCQKELQEEIREYNIIEAAHEASQRKSYD